MSEPEPVAGVERALAPDVVASLVRGVGSYMRLKPPQELPRSLRPLRGFRPQALMRRRADVLQALEDENLRAAILEWLDGRTPLARRDAEVLRVACERGDGWELRLAERGAEVPEGPHSAEVELRDQLEAERRRSRKHCDDLRIQRDQARRALDAEEARLADLARRLSEAEKELDEARAAATAATIRADKVAEDTEKRLRRERRAATKAKEEADEAKRELRSLKRALARAQQDHVRLQQRVDELTGARSRAKSQPAPAPRPADPQRRKPLRVARGRLPEDPETLDEWLSEDGIHLMIDGYNVTKAEGGFAELALERQRERLVDEVSKLAVRKKVRTTIVFDGSSVPPGTSRRLRRRVAVEYSRPDEPADDHLIAMLEAEPSEPAVLVTNDRELQARGAALGATIASSDQLLALIR
ncbi:MAG: NYN domain-containing protein [Actinomycetota bacterium]|nr:NYN domain-containing protein [Actinomycetota bacterium]